MIAQAWGITHADFFRGLPNALQGRRYTLDGDTILNEDDAGQAIIRLGCEGGRRIASLCLPVTHIEFRFAGLGREAVEAFLHESSGHYQRGGG